MTGTTKALARVLAARCRAERDAGVAEAAAERRVFDEFLASDAAGDVDWASFYQEFVGAFAPERRRALGVYYTPVEVVRAQVRLAADVLEQRLGCRGAFADPRVLIVDPAAGSGAYPLAVVADVLERTHSVPTDTGPAPAPAGADARRGQHCPGTSGRGRGWPTTACRSTNAMR